MDGDEHKAESLFKMFQKYLSKTPNWNPENVIQKLNLKSDNVWKSKTGSVHGTTCLIEETRFVNALKSGVNFISCIQTKNLAARDADNQPELCHYLTHQYDDQFTWCVGRARPNPKKFSSRDYCNTHIDIPDLNFGSDRRNQIAALCPIKDILMTITFEEKGLILVFSGSHPASNAGKCGQGGDASRRLDQQRSQELCRCFRGCCKYIAGNINARILSPSQDQVNGSMMSLDASSSPGHISHLAVAGVGLWVASYGASTVALYHTESFIHMQVGGAPSHPWCQTD